MRIYQAEYNFKRQIWWQYLTLQVNQLNYKVVHANQTNINDIYINNKDNLSFKIFQE